MIIAIAIAASWALTRRDRGLPQIPDGGLRALSFNYCGNVCAHGTDAGLEFVAEEVEESGTTVVLLQEVCRAQADHLSGRLRSVWGSADLHYVTTFSKDLDGANDCPGDDYGLALIGPRLTDRQTIELPNPGLGSRQIDERSMPCAVVDGRILVCTTHLVRRSNDREAHEAQVAAFTEAADRLADGGEPVLIAGDLNDERPSFKTLVDGGPYIDDSDADDIDHAFVTRTHHRRIAVDHRSCSCSDHAALLVTLTPRT